MSAFFCRNAISGAMTWRWVSDSDCRWNVLKTLQLGLFWLLVFMFPELHVFQSINNIAHLHFSPQEMFFRCAADIVQNKSIYIVSSERDKKDPKILIVPACLGLKSNSSLLHGSEQHRKQQRENTWWFSTNSFWQHVSSQRLDPSLIQISISANGATSF